MNDSFSWDVNISVEIIIEFSLWGFFWKVNMKAYSFLRAEFLFSSRLSVQLSIRTFASSGLIYYMAHQNQVDYAMLQLHEGRLHFTFDLGKGRTKVSHPALLSDGTWHTVRCQEASDHSFQICSIDPLCPLHCTAAKLSPLISSLLCVWYLLYRMQAPCRQGPFLLPGISLGPSSVPDTSSALSKQWWNEWKVPKNSRLDVK